MPLYVAHPLAYYAVLSVAMAVCLYLFLTTERKLESAKKRLDRDVRATSLQVAAVGTRVEELAERTEELEERVAGLAAKRRSQTPTAGIDANQRMQVLRLARRGDRPERIAAELRVPKSEVDLLLKVQRAIAQAS